MTDRDIDELVAYKIFGFTPNPGTTTFHDYKKKFFKTIPSYTYDSEAAREIGEFFSQMGFDVSLEPMEETEPNMWMCTAEKGIQKYETVDSNPARALCLTGLRILGAHTH